MFQKVYSYNIQKHLNYLYAPISTTEDVSRGVKTKFVLGLEKYLKFMLGNTTMKVESECTYEYLANDSSSSNLKQVNFNIFHVTKQRKQQT